MGCVVWCAEHHDAGAWPLLIGLRVFVLAGAVVVEANRLAWGPAMRRAVASADDVRECLRVVGLMVLAMMLTAYPLYLLPTT